MPNFAPPTDLFDKRFRPVAGIVLTDGEGRILVCERSDVAGQFQLPQGGIDAVDSSPLAAAYRELFEETAIPTSQIDLIAQYKQEEGKDFPHYMWPNKKKSDALIGAAMHFVLFKFVGDKKSIDVSKAEWKEFVSHQWVKPEWLMQHVVEFRRPAYALMLEQFEPLI